MTKLYLGDCLQIMKKISDKSIDFILADLPYGNTWQKWDEIIDFNLLWKEYNRISKGAVALFSSGHFTTKLIQSNIKEYKYSWYWIKNNKGNYLNAKYQPMRQVEMINLFNKHPYYPQGLKPLKSKRGRGGGAGITLQNYSNEWVQEKTGYPSDVLYYDLDKEKLHPTQKPVALLEYLIKTYTLKGQTVLDNTMGSGGTGLACKNLERKFIGIEQNERYFEIAKNRIGDR